MRVLIVEDHEETRRLAHGGQIPGAGLGLAVVHAVVARHGGDVRTGPGPMGGESIRISLPLLSNE